MCLCTERATSPPHFAGTGEDTTESTWDISCQNKAYLGMKGKLVADPAGMIAVGLFSATDMVHFINECEACNYDMEEHPATILTGPEFEQLTYNASASFMFEPMALFNRKTRWVFELYDMYVSHETTKSSEFTLTPRNLACRVAFESTLWFAKEVVDDMFIVEKRGTIAKPRYEFYMPRVIADKISQDGVNAAVLQQPAK